MSNTEQEGANTAGVRPAPEAETAGSFRLRPERPHVTPTALERDVQIVDGDEGPTGTGRPRRRDRLLRGDDRHGYDPSFRSPKRMVNNVGGWWTKLV